MLAQMGWADPTDVFDFEPAPLMENIEGTWVTENKELGQPIYYSFCRLSDGGVQMSRMAELTDNRPVQYVYRMLRGTNRGSVSQVICDRQFGGVVKIKFGTYYHEDKNMEVVMGMTVRGTDIWDSKVIATSMMRKVSSERPAQCDSFEMVGRFAPYEQHLLYSSGSACGL